MRRIDTKEFEVERNSPNSWSKIIILSKNLRKEVKCVPIWSIDLLLLKNDFPKKTFIVSAHLFSPPSLSPQAAIKQSALFVYDEDPFLSLPENTFLVHLLTFSMSGRYSKKVFWVGWAASSVEDKEMRVTSSLLLCR